MVDVDDEVRQLTETVIEGRLPLLQHHATFQLSAEGADHGRLVWIANDPLDSLAAQIRLRVEPGSNTLKRQTDLADRDQSRLLDEERGPVAEILHALGGPGSERGC